MALELVGKVVEVLQKESGEGRNGTWVKQNFVIETDGHYPKKVCFTAWGDKADVVANLNSGDPVTVHFDIESREYNGRWYTDAKMWRLDVGSNSGGNMPGTPPPIDYVPDENQDEEGDLPF